MRPSLYMDGPRHPGQGTLHCASASRDGGRRNARHAAFPAPGRPIRGCAAARHATSLLSAGISTGSGAWTRRRWVEPRRRERGALPDMAALAAAGHRALGSMGRIPAKRFAASRSASLRFDGLYIDASRSNARTLSAPLWRIGRLRDFRAESVSQAIATSHGSEDERFDGGAESPARFPHLRYAFSSTVSRTQRDIRPGTARLHRSEHRRLREPFSPIRTKRGTESPTPDSARFTV